VNKMMMSLLFFVSLQYDVAIPFSADVIASGLQIRKNEKLPISHEVEYSI